MGTPPSEARADRLKDAYNDWGADASGWRHYASGPFASSRSFKNGRFDLTFRSAADA